MPKTTSASYRRRLLLGFYWYCAKLWCRCIQLKTHSRPRRWSCISPNWGRLWKILAWNVIPRWLFDGTIPAESRASQAFIPLTIIMSVVSALWKMDILPFSTYDTMMCTNAVRWVVLALRAFLSPWNACLFQQNVWNLASMVRMTRGVAWLRVILKNALQWGILLSQLK